MFSQASVILFTGRACIPACTEADTPSPPWADTPSAATAADGTHPSGMHSCSLSRHLYFTIGNLTIYLIDFHCCLTKNFNLKRQEFKEKRTSGCNFLVGDLLGMVWCTTVGKLPEVSPLIRAFLTVVLA